MTKWTVSQTKNGQFCVSKKRGRAKAITLGGLAAPSLQAVLIELMNYARPGDLIETPEGVSVYSKAPGTLPS